MALLGLGDTELLVIFLVAILLFGATAIPKLARSMGRAKGEFVKAKREFDAEAAKAASEPATSEEQVRKTARDLGIAEQGKSLPEVKALIAQKLA
ncbi:MAG: sec-independent protein translocase protein TatA [Thermoplasmata archaeon]|jgi:sec-independent protein translocase protein TatA|nr:sec-independent protein translocase protein TatA [Thermoplasmata archaeon]